MQKRKWIGLLLGRSLMNSTKWKEKLRVLPFTAMRYKKQKGRRNTQRIAIKVSTSGSPTRGKGLAQKQDGIQYRTNQKKCAAL